MIIVTCATGQLGRQIVEGILARRPDQALGVSVRDPAKTGDWARRGVRVVRGDFAEPATLAAAFEGAEQVLVISVNQLGEVALQQHETAIRAAREAGAKRVLYTSHQAASPTSAFPPARDHAATEGLLQRLGGSFVSLRNGFYAESGVQQLGGVRETGRIRQPQDGPVSWTARADLAEAAVAALLDPGLFDGISPPLTADRAVDLDAVARLASEALGREVVREVVDDADHRAAQVAQGRPAWLVDLLMTLFQASRAGEFNVVDPTLARILGRTPTSFQTILGDHLAGNGENPH